jgi:drug/metabolite transporter (DMT)-like permease
MDYVFSIFSGWSLPHNGKISFKGYIGMFNYVWPLALVVLSNVFYQICAKSVPAGMNPLASLTITYVVGAVASFILYYALNKDANIIQEYSKVNWAPVVLGLVIVGLEVGYIYAYKAGWPVSTAQIVQAAVLAVILIFVGYLLYHEAVTWNKIAGIIVCFAGLVLINIKP